jgi:hypothetical protein
VKLTARIATMLRTSGARRTDSVGAVATPGSSSRSQGSGAPSRRAPLALAAGLAVVASLAFSANASANEGEDEPPTFTLNPPASVSYDSVELSGTIDRHDQRGSLIWGFEYTTDPLVEGWNGGPQFGGAVIGAGPRPVTMVLENLKPGTEYQFRLVTENTTTLFLGTWYSEEPNPTFTTLAVPNPTLNPGLASEVAYTTAHLDGSINPHEGPIPITYHFEYSADPATEGWLSAGFGEVTAAEAEGSAPIAVHADLQELRASTQYEYRLVAYGNQFASAGPNPTFSTEVVAPPSVSIDPITTFTDTTAHFSGHVDPNAPAGTLSPADEDAYRLNWHFECTPECPGLAGETIEATEGSQPVTADATGLEPNTTYEVKLVGSNANGPVSAEESFATNLIHAGVKIAPGSSDGEGGYFLQGVVNPHNSAVSDCNFEYGLTTTYGQTIPCESSPGSTNQPVVVTAHPTGLTIGATYHVQLSIVNGAGLERSGDGVVVVTPDLANACPNEALRAEDNSLALPECRAYELVSNAFKNGFIATPPIYYAEDGSVFDYASGGAFAGVGLAGPTNRYVATRSDAGWKTDGRNPSGPDFAGTGWADASTDFQSSLYWARRATESSTVQDFYLRKPDGSVVLVGPGANHPSLPASPPSPESPGALPDYRGASADLSHMIFRLGHENSYPGGGSSGTNLYEYVGTGNDTPRLVGLDNSDDLVSQCGTDAGSPSDRSYAMSTDGRVIFFSAMACSGGPAATELWARVDGTTSYDASHSQCTRSDCNAPADAAFQGAAADGSRVYFTTTEQLVNGDTDETNDLYEYDLPTAADPNPSPTLTEVSGAAAGANVEGVTRISDDGSRVYFVANGVLAANNGANEAPAQAGGNNLYVWKRDADQPAGQTTFVAKLVDEDADLWGRDFRMAQTTGNGRYLVLSTSSPLVATDTDIARDVYRYDATTGEIVRLSADSTGSRGNTPGLNATFFPVESIGASTAVARPRTAMSADGSSVAFLTNESLSPADVNGAPDIYLWHAGHLSLISDGQWPEGVGAFSTGGYVDGSGEDVFFTTAQQLTRGDGDTTVDIYDAHVDGGFSFATPAPCVAEGCQLAPSGQPTAPAPATDQANGSGNVKPVPKHCAKGKVVRHGRCVKKAKKHHKKAHKKTKRANANHGGAK